MYAWLANRLTQHPWISTAILAVATLAIAAGALFIRFDFSVSSFFGSRDPETAYLTEYEARWGAADLLIIVADGGERGLLDRERLDELDGLAGKLEAVEGVGKVISVTRVPRVNRGLAGTFIPVPLLATAPRAPQDDPRVVAWTKALLQDPQVVPQYLSADGRYGTILVALDVDTNDLTQVSGVVEKIDALLAEHPVEGVTTYAAGVPAIRANVLDVVVADQVFAVPISAVLIVGMLALLFRSSHGILIPGVAAGLPLVMLIGFMGWMGEPFGLLNQVYLALIPAIAIADAVHLVARFHEESREDLAKSGGLTPAQRDAAIARTLQAMGVACLLTSLTTMLGFGSLVTTEMGVLRTFGLYAAAGVGFAYLTVLVIVPLALRFVKSGARRLSEGNSGLLGRMLSVAAHLAVRRSRSVLLGSAVVVGAAVYAGTWVRTDWTVTETFHPSHPVSIANQIVDQHLGGVLALEFDLEGPPGAFGDPKVLAATDAFEREASTASAVRTTIGPASLLRTTARLVAGRDFVPDTAEGVEKLYTIADQAGIVSAFVSPDRSRARVLVRSADVGAVAFLAQGAALGDQLQADLAPLGVRSHLTGSTFVSSRGISRVTRDLYASLLSAFLLIGVVIAVLFRSVRYGVLSLVPNAVPLIAGYGLMGVLDWELEPGRAVVFTIAIGLSVDSAIHMLSRYREEREGGADNDAAIEGAVFHSGRAILITSLMLTVGFAANIFSLAPANAAFGRLGSVTILAGVVANLLILPALLSLGFGSKSTDRGADSPL